MRARSRSATHVVRDMVCISRPRGWQELLRRFGPETDFKLTFSIGGQIGIDVCPVGWDKTFCLQFVPPEAFDVIHFFGDKTHKGAHGGGGGRVRGGGGG